MEKNAGNTPGALGISPDWGGKHRLYPATMLMAGEGRGPEYRSTVEQLSLEMERFEGLRELQALKAANRCLNEEIEQVKLAADQAQREVMQLLVKVERLNGGYDSLQHEINCLLCAIPKHKSKKIEMKAAA